MAKIRWSDIEGQQVSQFFLGEMYQFEYETFEADKYYDAFPVIFVLRRIKKIEQLVINILMVLIFIITIFQEELNFLGQ